MTKEEIEAFIESNYDINKGIVINHQIKVQLKSSTLFGSFQMGPEYHVLKEQNEWSFLERKKKPEITRIAGGDILDLGIDILKT
ncbi:MAG: hypothetical protein WCM93_15010 [Bacteroidota bacterium]